MAKTANVYARIEPDVKMPTSSIVDASALPYAEMDAEIEKGYADIKAGRTKPAKSAFADIRKDLPYVRDRHI